MPDTILRLEGISKSFPGVKALENVSFEVRRGEVHVLLGENGAGKSTLIKILTGVYAPDEGRVFLNGEEVRLGNTLRSREVGIGTVFQENSLLPHLNVAENIYLTRELRTPVGTIDWGRTYRECEKWTHELGIDIDPYARVGNLSVAEQQIVEIVKVFSQNPKLVVLDEPTSSLSDNEIDKLFEIMVRMQQKGITFIYVSHRMEEIQRVGDRCTVLRDGKMVGAFENVKQVKLDDVISLIVGRTLEEKFPKRVPNIGEVVMEAEDVTVPNTIYDVSFQVRRGEVLGFAGLVGAGRTSTARAVTGASRRTKGKIRVNGREVRIKNPIDAIRNGIGYLPEDRKFEGLILKKSVKENISLPSLRRKFAGLFCIKHREEQKAAENYCGMLRVKTPNVDRLTRFLSGGNQQKVVFAKWLCADSVIYIFDEPTRGIDVGSKSEIYKIINDLVVKGAAVIVISSELSEILGICDRVLVMHEGRVTGEMSIAEATQEKIMYYALGGDG